MAKEDVEEIKDLAQEVFGKIKIFPLRKELEEDEKQGCLDVWTKKIME